MLKRLLILFSTELYKKISLNCSKNIRTPEIVPFKFSVAVLTDFNSVRPVTKSVEHISLSEVDIEEIPQIF